MDDILCGVQIKGHPNLLVGLDHHDDSAVYQLREDLAVVQSLDFFTPIVDDPFTFGQIAAANALSDIYAMGATPVTALNIVGFPVDRMDKDILKAILQGGISKVEEAGATLVGGHSIKDDEVKYGLSVTGTVHPDQLISNQGARVGDRLILTKALGTGIIATALKQQRAGDEEIKAMTASMTALNRVGGEIIPRFKVHAMTDVTGYGLIGHLMEILDASDVAAELDSSALPLLPRARHWADEGALPGGLKANRKYYSKWIHFSDSVPESLRWLVCDPQTSGGLLICVAESDAANLSAAIQATGTLAQDIGVIQESTEATLAITLR